MRAVLSLLLTLGLAALSFEAIAQQPAKLPRVGFLLNMAPPVDGRSIAIHDGFMEGMRERGYVDGKNVVIEKRWAAGKLERLPDLAAELVQQGVDVLVVGGQQGLEAAMKSGPRTPTVAAVCDWLGGNLARPDGLVTGMTCLSSELAGKRLELLKETFPRLARVAVMYNPAVASRDVELRQMQPLAKSLGLQLYLIPLSSEGQYEDGFRQAQREGAQAIFALGDPLFNNTAGRLNALSVQYRIPAIYPFATYVQAGGLMSYGADIFELNRLLADYVDRILKGARPGDLPVQQPTHFDLAINLKTAREMGVTFPQTVRLRASRVVE